MCVVSSPVRGSEISQESGRWLPHAGDLLPHGPHPPFLITSPKGGMRWSRVGCLSLGIDSPPFYGPPLCPLRPSKLSPTTPSLSIGVCVLCSGGWRIEGIIANNFPPRPRGWLMAVPNHLRSMYHHLPFFQCSFYVAAGWGLEMTRYLGVAGRVGLDCG